MYSNEKLGWRSSIFRSHKHYRHRYKIKTSYHIASSPATGNDAWWRRCVRHATGSIVTLIYLPVITVYEYRLLSLYSIKIAICVFIYFIKFEIFRSVKQKNVCINSPHNAAIGLLTADEKKEVIRLMCLCICVWIYLWHRNNRFRCGFLFDSWHDQDGSYILLISS